MFGKGRSLAADLWLNDYAWNRGGDERLVAAVLLHLKRSFPREISCTAWNKRQPEESVSGWSEPFLRLFVHL